MKTEKQIDSARLSMRENQKKKTFKNGSCLELYNSEKSKSNTSGIKGVSFHKKSNKWRAQIRYRYKSYYLGIYENIEEAAMIRKAAEQFIKNHFDNPGAIVEYLKNK